MYSPGAKHLKRRHKKYLQETTVLVLPNNNPDLIENENQRVYANKEAGDARSSKSIMLKYHQKSILRGWIFYMWNIIQPLTKTKVELTKYYL